MIDLGSSTWFAQHILLTKKFFVNDYIIGLLLHIAHPGRPFEVVYLFDYLLLLNMSPRDAFAGRVDVEMELPQRLVGSLGRWALNGRGIGPQFAAYVMTLAN